MAVCLLPGTELAFDDGIAFESSCGFHSIRRLDDRVARFRHINEQQPNTHHDALEVADGTTVLLTHLCTGQHATVLQLPAGAASAHSDKEEHVGMLVT